MSKEKGGRPDCVVAAVTFAESDRPRQPSFGQQEQQRQNYGMNYSRYQQAQGAGRRYRGNTIGQRGSFGGVILLTVADGS